MTSMAEASGRRASSRLLVGRQDALARLETAYDAAVGGHHVETVIVEGPAGIGKTRVVQELLERVRSRGGDTLVGRCVAEGERILPYAPVVDLLSELVRREGAEAVLRAAGPAAGELGRLVPALSAGTAAEEATGASGSRLFQALSALLDTVSLHAPLAVVVEDLHWADPSTRELLSLLAHRLHGDVLLVLTLRTDESPSDPGLLRLVSEVGRRAGRRVTLRPLTRDEQAHQLSDILGVPPRRELLDVVYERAEGNPFFAEELLALGDATELPVTIRDLLLARLDALAPATRQVLRTASAVGRHVPHRLLEAVSDLTGDRLDDALRPAVDGHVLVTGSIGVDGYQFRHALLQEAVAGSLLPGEAARIHGRLARALTQTPTLAGDHPLVAGRVARHWYVAGDLPQALVASVAAAREAKGLLAFNEALAHYDRAITLLDRVPDADALLDEPRYWLLWSAAEVAHLAAHPARAADLVREAIDRVDPAAPHHHAYLYERLGRYLWMAADGQGSLAAYERAMALAPVQPPTRWRAAVLSGYSQILMLASRFAESAAMAREAIETARQVADARSIEGYARCNLGVDLARLGRMDEGVAELVEARRIAEETLVDVDDIARAMVNLQSVLTDAGRFEEAVTAALESVDVVEKLGLARRKGVWCRCDAAGPLILLGRHDEARRLLDEALALAPEGVDVVRTHLTYGELALRTGAVDEAAHHLDLARRDGTRLLDGQLVAPLHTALVELATLRGDLDAALAEAAEGQARLFEDEDASYCVPFFAAAAAATAEWLAARRGRSRATRPSAPVDAVSDWVVRAEQAIARIGGETPPARAHLTEMRCEVGRAAGASDHEDWLAAADAWSLLAVPYRASHCRLRAAEALLAGGVRDRAEVVLRSAWAEADRIGADHLRNECETAARRARYRWAAVDGDGGAYRLTAREREVLGLVADGHSDREIGARLFISHRTVERHVSNLLAKLDAARRSELTAKAHRAGLVERQA